MHENWLLELVKKRERMSKPCVIGSKIYCYPLHSKILWSIGGKIDWLRGTTPHIGHKEVDKNQYDTNLDIEYEKNKEGMRSYGNKINGQVNGGGVKVSIKTDHADIYLRKK